MILHLYNGRLRYDGPRTDVDGNEVDDWGFEGPQIPGVKGVVWTYGNIAFLFEDEGAYKNAKRVTRWPDAPFHHSLQLHVDADVIRTFNPDRVRFEFFGDWSLAQGTQL